MGPHLSGTPQFSASSPKSLHRWPHAQSQNSKAGRRFFRTCRLEPHGRCLLSPERAHAQHPHTQPPHESSAQLSSWLKGWKTSGSPGAPSAAPPPPSRHIPSTAQAPAIREQTFGSNGQSIHYRNAPRRRGDTIGTCSRFWHI